MCAGVCRCSGRTDVLPSLKSLRWLPIHERIIYKVAVLTYKIRTSSTPSYLSDLHPVTSSRSARSVDSLRLQTQRTRTELGRRAFSVAAPSVWNLLPAQLRLSGSLPTSKKHLKSLLFNSVFLVSA